MTKPLLHCHVLPITSHCTAYQHSILRVCSTHLCCTSHQSTSGCHRKYLASKAKLLLPRKLRKQPGRRNATCRSDLRGMLRLMMQTCRCVLTASAFWQYMFCNNFAFVESRSMSAHEVPCTSVYKTCWLKAVPYKCACMANLQTFKKPNLQGLSHACFGDKPC